MNVFETLIDNNTTFAANGFHHGLRMMPALRTIVIGCVDPRVDPTAVLGTAEGEVAAIRNVGGRVTPGVLHELDMLGAVTRAAGGNLGPGWEVIVLQHTDCGITRLADQTGMLTSFFGTDATGLAELSVSDPHLAVQHDVATLLADERLAGVRVSGLVYDVETGLVDPVGDPSVVVGSEG